PPPQPLPLHCTIVPNDHIYEVETKICERLSPAKAAAHPAMVKANPRPTCTTVDYCRPEDRVEFGYYKGPCELRSPPKQLEKANCERVPPNDPAAIQAMTAAPKNDLTCTAMYRCPPPQKRDITRIPGSAPRLDTGSAVNVLPKNLPARPPPDAGPQQPP